MFIWLLQLLKWQESLCDVDITSGFGQLGMEEDDHSHLTIMSSPSFAGSKSSKQMSPLFLECIPKDVDSLLQNVENELHQSAMGSCTEYVKFIVDEEVKKLHDSSRNDKLNEVS